MGEGRRVEKALRHLEDEAAVLEGGQETLLRVELQDQGRFQFSPRDAERPERSLASDCGRLEPRR
jgi:hypothetical protein